MTDLSSYPLPVKVLALTHYCQVTPRVYEALVRLFGTVDGILQAEVDNLAQVEGLSPDLAEKLGGAADRLEEAAVMAKLLGERDIKLVTQHEPEYGHLLMELNDPPPLLYVRGKLPDPHQKTAAVVGCQTASAEGIELTSTLVKHLVADGVQLVSTLTGGVDSAVHLTAATEKGGSFALLSGGVDQIDQQADMPVAIDIIQHGGVITEYSPEIEPTPELALSANRLVAGLAQAVILTELYEDSEATLDLVRACQEIGKLLFVLIDPELGALSDEKSLGLALECGAIPINGLDKIEDIVRSLV